MNHSEKERLMENAHDLLRTAGRLFDMAGANFIIFGGIGREKRLSWYNIEEDRVRCGCFNGTLAQYEDQIAKYAADYPHHGQEYFGAIEFIKACRAARRNYPRQDEKCCVEEACVPTPCPQPVYEGTIAERPALGRGGDQDACCNPAA
jgi:hypothetical protein